MIYIPKRNCKKSRQFELEKQLHEQYAINNNASVGSFVSFITTLFVLFGSFGYVFVNSTNTFSVNGDLIQNGLYTLDVFLSFSIVIIGLLTFLSLLSLHLGYTNRINQLIIENIRKKAFYNNEYYTVFGKNYSANSKNWFTFTQSYFNLFYWLFISAEFIIFFATLNKLSHSHELSVNTGCYSCSFCDFVLCLQSIAILFSVFYRNYLFNKYNKASLEK